MPSAKLAVAALLGGLALGGCGSAAVPLAGTRAAAGRYPSRGRIDDQRVNKPNHVACLRDAHLQVQELGTTGLRVGLGAGAPTVEFEPTPGIAQGDIAQGSRWAQGAEVIGSALLYPNQASDALLGTIETCLAQGVNG